MPSVPSVDQLRAVGRSAGLDAFGIAPAVPFEETRVELERRRREGLHGGMHFTYGDPSRSTDPGRTVPGARALVVGARRYRQADPAPPPAPAGAVARYARHDHYADLRRALDAVAVELRAAGWQARVLCDDNALVDREAAYRAGLGWYGKNANLLLEGHGSWFVLGSVVTDAPLEPSSSEPVGDGCGTCTRCIDACPTAAIIAPGVVDARRCLAWLVQAKGSFPVEFRSALGGRLYGCDDCQEVCPPNRLADRRRDLADESGAAWVPLVDLLEADDQTLLARHAHWYIPRRDPRYLRRNALVALGNVASPEDDDVRDLLDRFADGDDELLAEHARWARRRLASRA